MCAKYVTQDLTPSDHGRQFIFPTAMLIYSSLSSPRTEPALLQTARNYLSRCSCHRPHQMPPRGWFRNHGLSRCEATSCPSDLCLGEGFFYVSLLNTWELDNSLWRGRPVRCGLPSDISGLLCIRCQWQPPSCLHTLPNVPWGRTRNPPALPN